MLEQRLTSTLLPQKLEACMVPVSLLREAVVVDENSYKVTAWAMRHWR